MVCICFGIRNLVRNARSKTCKAEFRMVRRVQNVSRDSLCHVAGSLAIATYGIAHIPKALENYKTRQIAATQASMHHIAGLLEDFRVNVNHGAYPSPQQFKVVMGGSLPTDYWESSIKYEPRTDSVADKNLGLTMLSNTSFELRSAGPDGIVDTDDDIIMRDGIFFTNAELKKKKVVQQLR